MPARPTLHTHGLLSNDARGTTITVAPTTGDPADRVLALVRSRGFDLSFTGDAAG